MVSEPHVVSVSLGPRTYDIVIGRGLIASVELYAQEWLKKTGQPGVARTGLIITDSQVADPHAIDVQRQLEASGWKLRQLVVPAGEQSKSLESLSAAYDALIDLPADRQSVVFAVGGGVVGDLAGFVAATWMRGIPFVQLPTTLLANVDSSVGGKTGINHPLAKNMIGAFHQPAGVLIDLDCLSTLPEREYRSGLAEVVKYGVLYDAAFFASLEASVDPLLTRDPAELGRVIAHSCRIKADIVEQDEFEETGLRAKLNFGHTFGHAYEALCGYGVLLHGEAVSIGMVHAAQLAQRLELIDSDLVERLRLLLMALELPVALPTECNLTVADVLARMRLDKKSVAGTLRFVLPTSLGHVELRGGVPELVVQQVLQEAGLR